MNFQQTYQILSDLPQPFTRFGSIFNAILLGFTIACARNNISIDAINQNIYTNNARWGWLDAFGQMYGVLRNQYETDPQYRTRLIGTLTAPHGTPLSISQFIKLALRISTYITENFSTPSFTVNFNTPVNSNTLQNIANTILWVRPAGVPFLPLFSSSGGLFLFTLNYLNGTKVTGSYLSNPHISGNVTISAGTPNPICTLPTTYFTDPFINPTLATNSTTTIATPITS